MDWISLIGPALVAAGVSGAIAVVGFMVTTRTVRRLRADRLEFDFALSAHRFNLDDSDGSTGLPRGPANSAGPAWRSSTMIWVARAAARAGRASSACWPRSAMAASGRFWRSRYHVSPATAATGIH